MKPLISYADFDKLDLRIGTVLECERKEGSEKLLRLTVDFGTQGTKTILSGIYPVYQPEDMVQKSFVFIINIEPRKIMGEESQGMILATDGEIPTMIIPTQAVPSGTGLR